MSLWERLDELAPGLNPYFNGLSILIIKDMVEPIYILKVSILILMDYLFLYSYNTRDTSNRARLNPYFNGLSILIYDPKALENLR